MHALIHAKSLFFGSVKLQIQPSVVPMSSFKLPYLIILHLNLVFFYKKSKNNEFTNFGSNDWIYNSIHVWLDWTKFLTEVQREIKWLQNRFRAHYHECSLAHYLYFSHPNSWGFMQNKVLKSTHYLSGFPLFLGFPQALVHTH